MRTAGGAGRGGERARRQPHLATIESGEAAGEKVPSRKWRGGGPRGIVGGGGGAASVRVRAPAPAPRGAGKEEPHAAGGPHALFHRSGNGGVAHAALTAAPAHQLRPAGPQPEGPPA